MARGTVKMCIRDSPKSEIDALIDGIESGKVNRLKSINAEFEKMHSNYYTYEWTWAYEKLEEFYGIKRCV